MQVISAREFRSSQSKFLSQARQGDDILLTSREGTFRIVPVTDEDTLTTRICRGLRQVKMISDGKLPRRTIQDMLNDL